MINSFEQLKNMLSGLSQKKSIGVVAAHDEHTLDAVVLAAKDGMVEPILLGDENKIKSLLLHLDYPIEQVEIKNIESPEECAKEAARMVRQGKLDCVMKGKIETGSLMRVMVNKEYGIRQSDTMSHVAFIESPHYHKVFAITDGALLTYPTLEQKIDMTKNAVLASRALGTTEPKVAVLAAIEQVNPKMKETVEADQIKRVWQDGKIANCIVEGPISYDLAMDAEAAKVKEYCSPVAGDADILVVPDIVAGNLLTKSLLYTGGSMLAGAIIGAMVPLVLTSRSSSMQDKYMSIVLNALIGRLQ